MRHCLSKIPEIFFISRKGMTEVDHTVRTIVNQQLNNTWSWMFRFQYKFNKTSTEREEHINKDSYGFLADYSTVAENNIGSVFEIQYIDKEGAGFGCIQRSKGNVTVGFNGIRGYSGSVFESGFNFNTGCTFIHIVNSTNDKPIIDILGLVFSHTLLIHKMEGLSDIMVNGTNVLNDPFSDYSEQWNLGAPERVVTISLKSIAYVRYYIARNYKYEIFSQTATEMLQRTTDGNDEFDWWFTLTTEAKATNEFTTNFISIVWEDDFNDDGAPDPLNWRYHQSTETEVGKHSDFAMLPCYICNKTTVSLDVFLFKKNHFWRNAIQD